ncbi:MAG: bifunctional RNase H/acid phosphatase [Bifidobacteriaceae bacterium]|nr:bifunctional RNase H/acid phosphatase [Bifidobacteriaceae bacterium]
MTYTRLIVEADGGSRGNPGTAGYGALVRDAATGAVLAERAAYLGETVTNNVAEYSGLIAGLEAAQEVDPAAALEVRMDSKLVVNQMAGVWKIKHPDLQPLAAQARTLLRGRSVQFTWVPRAQNQAADALANQAMDTKGVVHQDTPSPGGSTPTPTVTPGSTVAPTIAPTSASPTVAAQTARLADTEVPAASVGLAAAVHQAQQTASGTQRQIGVSTPATTVILVRHGMSVSTGRDVFAGGTAPGPSLSESGVAQAQAAALELTRMLEVPWYGLESPSALIVSPTARTQETAAPFAAALDLKPQLEASFAEEDFGQWDGLDKAEVEATWPGGVVSWYQDPHFSPGGGESRHQLGQRIKVALSRVVGQYAGQTVVVVTHAMVTRAAIGVALGAPPEAWFTFRVAPASLNLLRFWDLGHTEVVCTNRTVAPC